MSKHTFFKGLLLVAFFGVALAAYAVFEVALNGAPLSALLQVAASFGCFGALLGGIFAFDPQSEFKVWPSAGARASIGAIAAAAFALLWTLSAEAMALLALVGGVLGYFGMCWAKYVDF
jgi:hypothetical protein